VSLAGADHAALTGVRQSRAVQLPACTEEQSESGAIAAAPCAEQGLFPRLFEQAYFFEDFSELGVDTPNPSQLYSHHRRRRCPWTTPKRPLIFSFLTGQKATWPQARQKILSLGCAV
jgi:hypothetical protein